MSSEQSSSAIRHFRNRPDHALLALGFLVYATAFMYGWWTSPGFREGFLDFFRVML